MRWRQIVVCAQKTTKSGCIEIVLASNTDEREQGIAARIVSAATIRRGLAISEIGHAGQSEAIHSPEAWVTP
jgi:hypothetical protein